MMHNNTGKNVNSSHRPSTAAATTTPTTGAIPYHLLHHHQNRHPFMIPFSPSPSLLSFSGYGGGSGGADGGDDDDDFPRRDERFPQWSNQETRDFIEIRAQFELEFTTAKRDKKIWEIVANRMRDKGFRRTPNQCKCKWDNLVSGYKEQETAGMDNGRQCPFFNELYAVFTARSNRMQPHEPNADTVIANASRAQSHKCFSREQDDHEEKIEVKQATKTRAIPKRENPSREKRQKTAETENCKNNSVVNSVREIMMNFMAQQQMIDARWRELMERHAEERVVFEDKWRQKMESLDRERAAMEKDWREREEQRWSRYESRAEKRDTLLTMLLNKLIRDEI